MFLGRWDWASDQIEFTDDNEYLITFEKKKPWDVRWCCSLSSWLERKSLRTSLVDLYTSYWILVWQLDDNNNGLLTDPPVGSSLLNHINYNFKKIKLSFNYKLCNTQLKIEVGLTEWKLQ